ncbi:MAG: hypothetical protein LBS21_02420 [Clostridiales bacterium]|jgi:predicted membrane protein|nr:hypothetical protein [Clostridiales bacterium]
MKKSKITIDLYENTATTEDGTFIILNDDNSMYALFPLDYDMSFETETVSGGGTSVFTEETKLRAAKCGVLREDFSEIVYINS